MTGPTVSRFKKLQELSAEQRGQLDALLLDGKPAQALAEMIQKEWKLLTGEKIGTVKKMLERYRSTDLRNQVVHQVTRHVTSSHLGGLAKKLNAVEELTSLAMIQKTRFEKMYVQEVKGPLLMSTVSTEGKLLKEMLVELGKLQLETGIIQRMPKKLTGQVTDEHGNTKQFEWTEEQENLFKAVDAFEANGIFEVG